MSVRKAGAGSQRVRAGDNMAAAMEQRHVVRQRGRQVAVMRCRVVGHFVGIDPRRDQNGGVKPCGKPRCNIGVQCVIRQAIGTVAAGRRLVDIVKHEHDGLRARILQLLCLGKQPAEFRRVVICIVIKSWRDPAKHADIMLPRLFAKSAECGNPVRIPWHAPVKSVALILFRGVEIGVHAKAGQLAQNARAMVPVQKPAVISLDIATQHRRQRAQVLSGTGFVGCCHSGSPGCQPLMRSVVAGLASASMASISSRVTATQPAVCCVWGSRRCRNMALPSPATGGASL